MEGYLADRPTGHVAALASAGFPPVLAAKIPGTITPTADSGKDDRIDPRDGEQQPLVGEKRIQGELLKLNITVSKRTIGRYIGQVRPLRPHGQGWARFLQNHAPEIWACDFLQLHDALFRPLFAFFITELGSRRIVHVGVTRSPTDDWAAEQLREATPFGATPWYLIRDNDAKYGSDFASVATGSGIEVLRTPIRAPRTNAICERLLGSVRRECLDHVLILSEAHLRRILNEYVRYFNRS